MITLPNCRVSILRFCFLWVSFYNFSVSHCRILFLSLIAYRIISAWLFKYFKLMLTARNNRLHVYNLWRHLVGVRSFGGLPSFILSHYRDHYLSAPMRTLITGDETVGFFSNFAKPLWILHFFPFIRERRSLDQILNAHTIEIQILIED